MAYKICTMCSSHPACTCQHCSFSGSTMVGKCFYVCALLDRARHTPVHSCSYLFVGKLELTMCESFMKSPHCEILLSLKRVSKVLKSAKKIECNFPGLGKRTFYLLVRCPDPLADGRTFSKSGGDPVYFSSYRILSK